MASEQRLVDGLGRRGFPGGVGIWNQMPWPGWDPWRVGGLGPSLLVQSCVGRGLAPCRGKHCPRRPGVSWGEAAQRVPPGGDDNLQNWGPAPWQIMMQIPLAGWVSACSALAETHLQHCHGTCVYVAGHRPHAAYDVPVRGILD